MSYRDKIMSDSEHKPTHEEIVWEGEPTWDDTFFVWPNCPECDHPRLAMCPYCKMSGDHFPDAYGGPPPPPIEGKVAANPQETLDRSRERYVICPTCDEPFVPRFFRRCTWCNYDFGEGVEPPEPAAPKVPFSKQWRNPRVIATLIGLGVVATVLFVLFSLTG